MSLQIEGIQGGTDDVILIDAPGQAYHSAPGIGIPVGRAQSRKGGHHIAAARVLHLLGHILRISRGLDKPQFIPEPLDRRPCNENGAFQGIGNLTVQAPGDGRHQTIFRENRFLPRIHQQER